MYERKSRLSPQKRARLIEHFIAGTTARAAAQMGGTCAVRSDNGAVFDFLLQKRPGEPEPPMERAPAS